MFQILCVPFLYLYFISNFCRAEVQTQGLMHARQMFYHWAISLALVLLLLTPVSGLQAMSHYTNFCVHSGDWTQSSQMPYPLIHLLSPDSFSLGKVNYLLLFILFSLISPLVMVNIVNLTGLDSPRDKSLGVFMVTLLDCISWGRTIHPHWEMIIPCLWILDFLTGRKQAVC